MKIFPQHFVKLVLQSLRMMLILTVASALTAEAASESCRLVKVAVRPKASFTRISFHLDRTPEYLLSTHDDGSVSLIFKKTGGSVQKRLRAYSDRFVERIRISPRGENLLVNFSAKGGSGVRTFWLKETSLLSVDVGPQVKAAVSPASPDRLDIWNGAGKLVREFDPPFKPVFPFLPTDRRELLKIVSEQDAQLFMLGESALYKGKAAQAEDLFSVFSKRESPVRPLATYRLGEARYILQKYDEALKAFHEAEKLWPEYMSINPAAAFYYADSIVRSGDFNNGRRILARLIASLAERKYAPLLLVRLADTLARQKHEMEAVAIYRTVTANFGSDKAGTYAALKLADREIFSVNSDTYQPLLKEYRRLIEKGMDASLREEALFKAALLESLYGPAPDALQLVKQYERKYPRGLFLTIVRGIREELLPIICRDLYSAGDLNGMMAAVQENREYLARCFVDAGFAERVDEAYTSSGAVKKLITLFQELFGREWAASSAPFMLSRVVDHALELADFPLAEATSRVFLEKYPHHELGWGVREKLGKVAFLRSDMSTVAAELEWLLSGSRPATFHESYYYLGKAMASKNSQKKADSALSRFIGLEKDLPEKSALMSDAYYVCAGARVSLGEPQSGLALYKAGLEIAGTERRDQFLYKIGELYWQEGKNDEAKRNWERVIKEGADPLWQKMARQSLADLDWREQVKEMSK